MRMYFGLSLALVLAQPARADTITETIQYSDVSSQNGPVSLSGPLFNPSLGTLTGVSLNFSGNFSAYVLIPGTNLPQQLTSDLYDTIFTPGQTTKSDLGSFPLTAAGNNIYQGGEHYDFTEAVSGID